MTFSLDRGGPPSMPRRKDTHLPFLFMYVRVLYVHSILYLILDLESLLAYILVELFILLASLILFIPSKMKVYYMTLSYMHIPSAM